MRYFYFGGVCSADFGVQIHYQGVHLNVLPPTRERLVEIPGRIGAYDYGVSFGPRMIKLDCQIIEGSFNNVYAQAQAAATALDPRNGVKPLILPDYDFYFNARISGSTDFAALFNFATFQLPFICLDPFAKAV